ncbi:hypothetical protein E1140_01505, partial [Fulvivirga lutimaris]|nr:hypothetical protein [Fulvivirga lutimaris]
MNKQKFNSLIQNYNSIPDDDRQGLQELAKSFPYSQVIHTLVAKANHDAKAKNAANSLNRAAMYATDRQILKEVILGGVAPKIVAPKKEPKPEQKPKLDKNTSVQINQGKQVHISISKTSFSQPADLLRNEVWADLEHLKESKAIYLDWLEKSEEEEVKAKKAPTKKPEIQKDKPATLKKAVSKVVKETKKATTKKATTKKETASKKPKASVAEKKAKATPAKKATTKKSTTKPAATKTATKTKASEKKP